MVGYQSDEVEQLEKIPEEEMEPLKVNPLTKEIIEITSLVSQGLSFKEIVDEVDLTEAYLLKQFINMPSLPRPYDIAKYLDD